MPLPDGVTSDGIRGSFINGIYETAPILYGENAYGFADTSETIQNIANALPIELSVDGERFSLDQVHSEGRLEQYERSLAMTYGQLERRLVWRTKSGKRIRIDSRRLVSLEDKAIACLVYRITVLDPGETDLEIRSLIDGHTSNKAGGDDPRLPRASHEPTLRVTASEYDAAEGILALRQDTVRSGLAIAVAVAHKSNMGKGIAVADDQARISLHFRIQAQTLDTIEIEKYIAYSDSRHTEKDDLIPRAKELSLKARENGYQVLREKQETFLDRYWQAAEIRLNGDLALQQSLNFSIFHLIQSAAEDGQTSIAAKALSGEGYEGHYFWDTEMYIFPFFLYTKPEVAKQLLRYRYSILDQARERAILMGQSRGALFPWRGISGRECSAYYPAGTAQYHINADICLAVMRYWDATLDEDFLWEMGFEILLESAVFYLDLGFMDSKKGFVIHEVTGPDEYSTLVNNNYFTNLMVQGTFESTAAIMRRLDLQDHKRLQNLMSKLGHDPGELLSQFEEAARRMYLPKDENFNLPLQDDAVLDREPWDFLNVSKDKYPLLLNYHPLVIYRYRVSKQADLLLSLYLKPDHFTAEEKRRAFDFYELFTTHDSSLSASVHAIVANGLGLEAKAYRYFMETARLDLDDTHGNTADGLHMANMAGNWLAMVSGYGGMHVEQQTLRFKPQLPKAWNSYEFHISFHGCLLSVKIDSSTVTYKLLEGKALSLLHFDQTINLTAEHDLVNLPRRTVMEPDKQRFKPKAIIFDVDGVLLSSDEEHYLAWQKLCDEEGIYFDRHINQRLRGVSRLACVDIILEQSERKYDEIEKIELATRKNGYYQEAIADIDEEAVLPGVKALLDELSEHDVLLASASSSQNAPTLLESCGLSHYFPVQVDGKMISKSKPDPEVFTLAAEKLGVEAESCLVFEDATAGIFAAKRAGMHSAAVGKIAGNYLELGADLAVWRLDQIHADDIV